MTREIRCLEEEAKMSIWLRQDWKVNRGRVDSQIVLFTFRMFQWARWHWGFVGKRLEPLWWLLGWSLGIEIPLAVEIGPRLRLYHPNGILINPKAVLGADCHLRHGVVIGNRLDRHGRELGLPIVGNNVELGVNCVLLGNIRLGNNVKVGASAVVVKNVAENCAVVGNPGRIIHHVE
jgi:serine acetyltransferase